MFRFTIREVMLLTALTGMGVGWWIDHQRNSNAAEDAKFLANVVEHGCHCQMAEHFESLREKYGVKSAWSFGDDAPWEELAARRKEVQGMELKP